MDSDERLSQEHVVAFMDIGTNSVRLLLIRVRPDHSFSILSEEKETVRLGEGLFQRNLLQPEAIRRAILVCDKFADMARSRGAEKIFAVATSATREAQNRMTFLRHLQRHSGLDVRVISGKEEARLIYLGVSSGSKLGTRRTLFVDIGGGSTEVIVGDQQQYFFLDSLKLGAIRLTTQFFHGDTSAAISPSRYARLQRFIRTRAIRTLQRLKSYSLDFAIGSSGTIMNLGEIAMRMVHKRGLKKDDVLTREQLRQVIQLLCSLPLEERKKIPGINPDRADIIIAGAAVIETLMQELDIPEIGISDRGLREGLPVDYLSRSDHPQPLELATFRDRSVLELGRRCGFDEAHARQVARLAWELFDSAREVGFHELGDWERELLEDAALLHDIGSFVSYSTHRAHSYYFIRNADMLGFDQTEVAIIATVALFHHKAFPRPKHPEFAELDKRSRQIVRVLCVLLRIAESLDRSHLSAVAHVFVRNGDKKSAVLEVTPAKDCQLELWELHNHEQAFEKVFGKKFAVKLLSPAAV